MLATFNILANISSSIYFFNVLQFTVQLLLYNELIQFGCAQRQGTSNLVGTSALGYSGNAIPIMVSPDEGNATCNGTSPVANYDVNFF